MLPLIDILIGSKEFPRRVTGITDERAALVELKARYGCALVGMTIGAAGAVVYGDGTFIESPGFEAPGGCRDHRRGDAFHGGLRLTDRRRHRDKLKLGNAVAAIKCMSARAPRSRDRTPTAPPSNSRFRSTIERKIPLVESCAINLHATRIGILIN